MMKPSKPSGHADKPGKFGSNTGAVVGKGKVMGPVRSAAGEIGKDYGSSYNRKSLAGMNSSEK